MSDSIEIEPCYYCGYPVDPTRLNPRQQAMAKLIAAGASNPELARQLHVSLSSVKHSIAKIYDKFGIPLNGGSTNKRITLVLKILASRNET